MSWMKLWQNKEAQATLEFTLTFIVLILFMVGIAKTMAWFGNNIGARAQYYQTVREEVISSAPGPSNIAYQQSKFSIFDEQ